MTVTCGGKAWTVIRRPTPSTGRATTGPPTWTIRRRIRTPGSPPRPPSARPSIPPGKIPPAYRSARFCSAAVCRRPSRWSTRPSVTSTACSWRRPWAPRRPRPPSARRRSAAIPSPCCRSSATTWPITGATGWQWASGPTSRCRRSSGSTGSARTRTASSSGPVSARTCAF